MEPGARPRGAFSRQTAATTPQAAAKPAAASTRASRRGAFSVQQQAQQLIKKIETIDEPSGQDAKGSDATTPGPDAPAEEQPPNLAASDCWLGAWKYGKKPTVYRIRRLEDGKLRFDGTYSSSDVAVSGILESSDSFVIADLNTVEGVMVGTIRLRWDAEKDGPVSNFKTPAKFDWGKDIQAEHATEEDIARSEEADKAKSEGQDSPVAADQGSLAEDTPKSEGKATSEGQESPAAPSQERASQDEAAEGQSSTVASAQPEPGPAPADVADGAAAVDPEQLRSVKTSLQPPAAQGSEQQPVQDEAAGGQSSATASAQPEPGPAPAAAADGAAAVEPERLSSGQSRSIKMSLQPSAAQGSTIASTAAMKASMQPRSAEDSGPAPAGQQEQACADHAPAPASASAAPPEPVAEAEGASAASAKAAEEEEKEQEREGAQAAAPAFAPPERAEPAAPAAEEAVAAAEAAPDPAPAKDEQASCAPAPAEELGAVSAPAAEPASAQLQQPADQKDAAPTPGPAEQPETAAPAEDPQKGSGTAPPRETPVPAEPAKPADAEQPEQPSSISPSQSRNIKAMLQPRTTGDSGPALAAVQEAKDQSGSAAASMPLVTEDEPSKKAGSNGDAVAVAAPAAASSEAVQQVVDADGNVELIVKVSLKVPAASTIREVKQAFVQKLGQRKGASKIKAFHQVDGDASVCADADLLDFSRDLFVEGVQVITGAEAEEPVAATPPSSSKDASAKQVQKKRPKEGAQDGDAVEVIVKDGQHGDVRVAVPAVGTILDVKKAFVSKLGRGDASTVELLISDGSGCDKCMDTDKLGSMRRFTSVSGRGSSS